MNLDTLLTRAFGTFDSSFESNVHAIASNNGTLTSKSAYESFIHQVLIDLYARTDSDDIKQYTASSGQSVRTRILQDESRDAAFKKLYGRLLEQRRGAMLRLERAWTHDQSSDVRAKVDGAIAFVQHNQFQRIQEIRECLRTGQRELAYDTFEKPVRLKHSTRQLWLFFFSSLYPWRARWGGHAFGCDTPDENAAHLRNDLLALLYIERHVTQAFFISMLEEPTAQNKLYSALKDAYYNHKLRIQ